MNVLEKKKYKVIRAIINDTDDKRVARIEQLYDSPPCTYTTDELRKSVIQRTSDFYNGKMELIPHDEIERKSVV